MKKYETIGGDIVEVLYYFNEYEESVKVIFEDGHTEFIRIDDLIEVEDEN